MNKTQLRLFLLFEENAGKKINDTMNNFVREHLGKSQGYSVDCVRRLVEQGVISNRQSDGKRIITILATGKQIVFQRELVNRTALMAELAKYHKPTWVCQRCGCRNESGKPSVCGHHEPVYGITTRMVA